MQVEAFQVGLVFFLSSYPAALLPLLLNAGAHVDLHAILLLISMATATKWPENNRGAFWSCKQALCRALTPEVCTKINK